MKFVSNRLIKFCLIFGIFTLVLASPLLMSSRDLMTNHMTQYEKYMFYQAVKLGDVLLYRKALEGVSLVVNPTLGPLALYDPNDKKIELSKDPGSLTSVGDKLAMGETLWHEVTHRLEDMNGDFKGSSNPVYDERNVEYMRDVMEVALRNLCRMEDLARGGASSAQLKKYWDGFLRIMASLEKDPRFAQMKKSELKNWFDFEVDPKKIERFYADGIAGLAIQEVVTGKKVSMPQGGGWELTGVVVRPRHGMPEADFRKMVEKYSNEVNARGEVAHTISIHTWSPPGMDKVYKLGVGWAAPPSILAPGKDLVLQVRARDMGCVNVPVGDGSFVTFEPGLWSSNDLKNWQYHSSGIRGAGANCHKNSTYSIRIPVPNQKFQYLSLNIGTSNIFWGAEVIYSYRWRK